MARRPATTLPIEPVEARLDRLVATLGNNRVARLLGVSRSQPSRWRSAKERMSPDNRRRVIDLDYVMARLHQEWEPDVALVWLESFNPLLGGRPADVLRLRGAGPVVGAIDAESAGAYA